MKKKKCKKTSLTKEKFKNFIQVHLGQHIFGNKSVFYITLNFYVLYGILQVNQSAKSSDQIAKAEKKYTV